MKKLVKIIDNIFSHLALTAYGLTLTFNLIFDGKFYPYLAIIVCVLYLAIADQRNKRTLASIRNVDIIELMLAFLGVFLGVAVVEIFG